MRRVGDIDGDNDGDIDIDGDIDGDNDGHRNNHGGICRTFSFTEKKVNERPAQCRQSTLISILTPPSTTWGHILTHKNRSYRQY